VVIRAIYAGSFDPITRGHEDLITRSCEFVDHLVVAVAVNSSKKALFTTAERVELIRAATTSNKHVEVTQFEGLLVDFAKTIGAKLNIRGLRAVSDLLAAPEKAGESRIRTAQALVQSQHYSELSAFELQMLPADANRDAATLDGVRRVAGAAFVATSDAFTSLPDIRQSQISTARSATEQLRSEIEHATAKTL